MRFETDVSENIFIRGNSCQGNHVLTHYGSRHNLRNLLLRNSARYVKSGFTTAIITMMIINSVGASFQMR
jgi:hypothetical protein